MTRRPDPSLEAPVLTDGTHWQFRVLTDSSAGPWREDLLSALREVLPLPIPREWPTDWRVFGPISRGSPAAADTHADLTHRPDYLELGGETFHVRHARAGDGHAVDLAAVFGAQPSQTSAWAYASFELPHDMALTFHLSSDYWMAWWLDGRPLIDTLAEGNRGSLKTASHPVDIHLPAGRHVLAVKVTSGKGGWGFAGEIHERLAAPGVQPTIRLECQHRFEVADPSTLMWLSIEGEEPDRIELNGQLVPLPMDGMLYSEIGGIPATILHPGTNTLRRTYDVEASLSASQVAALQYFASSGGRKRIVPRATIRGLQQRHAEVCSGPIVTDVGKTHLSVACRTNVPVAATLRMGEHIARSPAGWLHHWNLEGLTPAARHAYRIELEGVEATCGGSPKTLSPEHVTLGICADAGPLPAVWGKTSRLLHQHRPDAVLFVGDLVNAGRRDGDWNRGFFNPADALLADIACFSVPGNHDQSSPLYDRLLLPPGTKPNWARRFGSALLVGIDGAGDFSTGSPDARWLEDVLTSSSDASFTFAFNHYPTWSSGPHQRVDESGELAEEACRTARHDLLPLFRRHGVTAVFSGHDHFYERSEPPDSPTCIVTGGAGAYLYHAREHSLPNPHSKRLASVHHYGLLSIDAAVARLVVHAHDGSVIDNVVWSAKP